MRKGEKKKAVGSREGVMAACLSGPRGDGVGEQRQEPIETSERLNTATRRKVRKQQKIRATWGKKNGWVGGKFSVISKIFGTKCHPPSPPS